MQSAALKAKEIDDFWHSRGPGPGPGPRIMAADTLEGDTVKNAAGEDLGTLIHIMVDVPMGRIAYAVMSFGGARGWATNSLRFRGTH